MRWTRLLPRAQRSMRLHIRLHYPKRSYDQVVMEMTVTLDPLRTAVFSGSITPT